MGENWHYVSCKNKVQEIRGYKNYILFKQSNEVVDLHIVDTVFTNLEVELLQPLFEEKKEFIEQVERSVERIGFKDPFVVHNITRVPLEYKHGLFVKAGNNRIRLCKKFQIKSVPSIVVNLSGRCSGEDCYEGEFIRGLKLETEEDVKSLFYTNKVHITWRDGKILNAVTPKFLRVLSLY